MSKKLSKYIAVFYYIDKTLIVLSATIGGISIISFTRVISKCKFYCDIFFNCEDNKNLLKVARKKKKNHNKIAMLAKSKLNSIETLMSQALIIEKL